MVSKAKRERTPRVSLRGQVARLTAQLNEERQKHAAELDLLEATTKRATESAESYRRALTERVQATELAYSRELNAAKDGELKALRSLTQALTSSALHTDQLVSGLADAIQDALSRVPGLNLESDPNAKN